MYRYIESHPHPLAKISIERIYLTVSRWCLSHLMMSRSELANFSLRIGDVWGMRIKLISRGRFTI